MSTQRSRTVRNEISMIGSDSVKSTLLWKVKEIFSIEFDLGIRFFRII